MDNALDSTYHSVEMEDVSVDFLNADFHDISIDNSINLSSLSFMAPIQKPPVPVTFSAKPVMINTCDQDSNVAATQSPTEVEAPTLTSEALSPGPLIKQTEAKKTKEEEAAELYATIAPHAGNGIHGKRRKV